MHFFSLEGLKLGLLAGLVLSLTSSALVIDRAAGPTTSATPTSLAWPCPTKAYTNPKCTPVVRKSWRKMSTNEKSSYISAVQCITKKPSIGNAPGARNIFDDFQGTHNIQTDYIHWVGHFILWHRYYLAVYENKLRSLCGYKGAQPFWDWEYDNASGKDMTLFAVFDNKTGFGGNGPYVPNEGDTVFPIQERSGGGCVPAGPFTWPGFSVNIGPQNSTTYNPRCLRRDFSRPMMKWSNQEIMNKVWGAYDYTDFARRIEGTPDITLRTPNIHGGGHFGPGGALGSMGDPYNSPGDPLFYLHHANIDRVFWQWQWQKKNLPRSLNQVGGPIVAFDYDNVQGGNVTLDFEVGVGKLAPSVKLKQLLNTQGETLCYTYERP